MSPVPFGQPAPTAVESALRRVWVAFRLRIRGPGLPRRWSTHYLAERAGVSRSLVFNAERGDPLSLEAMARLTEALWLRLEFDLVDPRRKQGGTATWSDPVHSAMGEFEAAHFRGMGHPLRIDEPYQHYHF